MEENKMGEDVPVIYKIGDLVGYVPGNVDAFLDDDSGFAATVKNNFFSLGLNETTDYKVISAAAPTITKGRTVQSITINVDGNPVVVNSAFLKPAAHGS